MISNFFLQFTSSKHWDTFLRSRKACRCYDPEEWSRILGYPIQNAPRLCNFIDLCISKRELFAEYKETTEVRYQTIKIAEIPDTREQCAFPGVMLPPDFEEAKSVLYSTYGEEEYEDKLLSLELIRFSPSEFVPSRFEVQTETFVIPPKYPVDYSLLPHLIRYVRSQ
jgi:hypothetical protein